MSGQDYPDEEFSSIYCEHGFGGQYYTKSDKLNPVDEGAINDGCTFDELNSWTQAGTMRMVRKGDWKLTYDMEGNGQFYNLVEDPAELDNLFGQDKVKNRKEELMEELLQWTLWSQDTLPYPERRYQVKTNPANYRKN